MAVRVPFYAVRFLGARFGKNIILNRSFNVTANRWRDWARRSAQRVGLAAAGIAAGGIGIKAGISGGRVTKKTMPLLTGRKRPAPWGMPGFSRRARPARRKQVIRDPASYIQIKSYKARSGRKSRLGVRRNTRAAKLLKTVIQPVRYRFGTAQDLNAVNGTYWLTQSAWDANITRMPLYLVNLTAVNQGNQSDGIGTNKAPSAMWELCWDNSVGITGPKFHNVPGTDPTIGGQRFAYKAVQPSEATSSVLGRKALLDWTRVKLCIWGKTKNPATVKVSLVRFLRPEISPDYDVLEKNIGGGAGVMGNTVTDPDAMEYWQEKLKYLANGHMGGYGKINRSRHVKTLKSWVFNINPIDAGAETANSDARGHMKHLDSFNRWNRIIDFTDMSGNALGINQGQTLADLLNINRVPTAGVGFTGLPCDVRKCVYLMIESIEPAGATNTGTPSTSDIRPAPADTSFSCSFDLIVETNYSKLEGQLVA